MSYCAFARALCLAVSPSSAIVLSCCCNVHVLYNSVHKKNCYVTEKKLLEKYNYNNITLNDTILVIPKLNILHTDLYNYIKLFKENKLEDLIKLHIIIDHHNDENNMIIHNQFKSFISNLEGSNYWTNQNKCKLNMTNEFIERSFKLNFEKGEISDEIRKVLDNIDTNFDYLNELNKHNFVDISSSISQKMKFTLYRIINKDLSITKDEINELFDNLDSEYLKYTYFNRLSLSKIYTHLVVNNSHILNLMQDIFKKFLPIYKYIFGYIWLYYAIEEKIKKTNISENDRFIFIRDTASLLPHFPFYHEDIHSCPYITLLVSKKALNNYNLYGVGCIKNYDYSIGTQDEFQKMINIFTTGKKNKSIFTGLDWTNIELSGSTMLACSLKCNPLINNFNYIEDEEKRINRYFNEYYCKSDLDILCCCSSVLDYIDKSKEVFNCVKRNLEEINETKIELELVVEKKLSIYLNKKTISDYLPKYSLQELEDKINSEEIINIFYDVYKKLKKERCSEEIKSSYEDYYNLVNIENVKIKFSEDIKLYEHRENTFYVSNNDDVYFRIQETMKYKMKSQHLKHNIEFFNVYNKNCLSSITRFHLPCVRSTTNHLTTASITAYKTGINLDYNYFNGMIDTIDIIIKYMIRGVGIVLNDIEKNVVIQYINKTKWKEYFQLNNIKDIFSPKTLDNRIYKPRRFLKDEYKNFKEEIDQYSISNYEYIRNYEDFVEEYKNISGYDNNKSKLKILDKKTINENGFPILLDWSFIEMAYHELK